MAHTKYWLIDPSKRLCQYEIPGGGECRDRECEDIHLSRTPGVEPSDEETAQYIYAHATMAPVLSQYNIKDIKDALEDARQRNPSKNFEGRVSEALVSLGLW